MSQPEDQILIERALSGDREAFGLLVKRYGRYVLARLSFQVRYPEDAEDLAQDVFLKAYARLGQLRDRHRLQPWLRSIADNAAHGWARRRAVQLQFEEMHCSEWPQGKAPSEDREDAELCAVVRRALQVLSEAQRQVVVHHYLKGYSYAETADLLDLREATVKSRLQKARRRLRKEISEMSEKKLQAQTFELTEEELAALRWAGAFVSRDEKRRVLQGICLDAGGKIVATDGHRLFHWVAENLKGLGAPVLLGPWPEEEIPTGERATLSFGETEAALHIPGSGEIAIPTMEGPYVKYEQVIPAPGPVCAVVRSGDLLDAIEHIGAHHAARPPAEPDDEWKHLPQEEIRLSTPAQTLSLLERRDLGYYRETSEGKHRPYDPERDGTKGTEMPGGAVDWTYTATIHAHVETDDAETFRCAVNHHYLRTVVSALQTDRGEDIAIRFTDPLKAIVFSSVRHPGRKTLLMPLRLV